MEEESGRTWEGMGVEGEEWMRRWRATGHEGRQYGRGKVGNEV